MHVRRAPACPICSPVGQNVAVLTREDLVGRDAELAAIRDVVMSAAGDGGVLILRGEAGIGKSSLLAEAATIAETAGHRILRASGVRTEAHLPFAGLHQMLRPLLGGLETLPSPQAAALRAAFGLSDSAAEDPFLVSLGTLTLLTEAAAHQPVVALVDDAQWLDQPTDETLGFVARRLGSDPVALIVAILEGEGSTEIGSVGLPITTVRPLDDGNARDLLGRRGAHLTTAVREHILQAAEGNPLALVELIGAVEDYSGDAATDALPVTARIEQTFAGKLAGIPERTSTLLLLAALDDQGGVDEIAAAGRLLGVADAGAEDLDLAIEGGLIAFDDGRLRFQHPMIRSTVVGRATDASRREAHRALAAVIADQDRSAWHSAAGVTTPDEAVAALLDAAAERAQRRGAIAAAQTLLEKAARVTPDGDARGARLLRAANHAYELGRLDIMPRLLEDAGPLASGALERRRQAWLQAVRLTGPKTAREAENVRLVVEAASQLADDDVDLAIALLNLAAARGWWMDLEPEIWARMIEVATVVAREADDPHLLFVKAAAGRDTAGVVDGVRRRLGSPDSLDPDPARILATSALWAGDLDAARQLFGMSVDGCRRQGRIGYAARGLVIGGWCGIQLGSLDDAVPALDEGLRLATETNQENFVATANSALAQYYALRGELEASARAIAAAERHGIHAYADGLTAYVSVARGLLALAAGHHADAFDALQHVFVPTDEAYHTLIRTWAIPELVDAAIPAGRAADAARCIDALERDRAVVAGPWPQITMAYARAVLAGGSDGEDEAEAAFSTALGADLERWPLPKARLLLAYGIWLRRRRRVAESRDPLRRARDLFDAIGVPWMADQARRELGATGEASSAPRLRSFDDLTPQEMQIARLAANGLSNREIGERLFVSHRTVGYHLYHVYPKLGISGRAQLHAALGAA